MGLHCWVWAFSSCSARGSNFGGFSCWGARALGCQGFGSCGTWAYWPCGMSWNLPGPGIKPVLSALAWGFLTTGHQRSPATWLLISSDSQSPSYFTTYEVRVSVAQSCPTLCNPMNCSLPGFSVHGILQRRILKWVAIPFSRGIFPGQGLNPALLHCRQILYHLSHQGPRAQNIGHLFFLLMATIILLYGYSII